MISKLSNYKLLIPIMVLFLITCQLNLTLFVHAEPSKLTVEPFTSDATLVRAYGVPLQTYGVFANQTYNEFTADAKGNVEFSFQTKSGSLLEIFEVNDLGELHNKVMVRSSDESFVSSPPPVFLGINDSKEAVFFAHHSTIHVKSQNEVFEGYFTLNIPLKNLPNSTVTVYSSNSYSTSELLIIDVTKPTTIPFELDESLLDSHIFKGKTLPSVSITISNTSDWSKHATFESDHLGNFSISADATKFFSKYLFEEPSEIRFSIQLNQFEHEFSKTYNLPAKIYSINENPFEISTLRAGDTFIQGKSTPFDRITIESWSDGHFLVQRADEKGFFKIRIPKAQYGNRYDIDSDFNRIDGGDSQIIIPDTRPLEKPSYSITEGKLTVVISHRKTTNLRIGLLLTKADGKFYTKEPDSHSTLDNGDYEYSFYDLNLKNGDQVKITASDGVVEPTSIQDTISGNIDTLSPLSDADKVIRGTTSPFSFIKSDIHTKYVQSDQYGKFELPLLDSESLPTKLYSVNKDHTQSFVTPLAFKDVTTPFIASHRWNVGSLYLSLNEKNVSIKLKTFDSLGNVIQTEQRLSSTIDYLFEALEHPYEIRKIELTLEDAAGHTSNPITLKPSANNRSLNFDDIHEGKPTVVVYGGKIGETIVVEYDNRTYEYKNTEWDEPAVFNIPNLAFDHQVTTYVKGETKKVTSKVTKGNVDISLSKDRKQISFIYRPGRNENISYQWILIDDKGIKFPLDEKNTTSNISESLTLPTSLPLNHSIRLIIKSNTNQVIYNFTQSFLEPSMPENPLNLSWNDQTSYLDLNIGKNNTIEGWLAGKLQFSIGADATGHIRQALSEKLKINDNWTLIIKSHLGIAYSHTLTVKDAIPPKLFSLKVPRSTKESIIGKSEPGIEVYVSGLTNQKKYTTDVNGQFVIPAEDFSFNEKSLKITLKHSGQIASNIEVPRSFSTTTIFAGNSTIHGQTIPFATVKAKIGQYETSSLSDENGRFEVEKPDGFALEKINWELVHNKKTYTFSEDTTTIIGKLKKISILGFTSNDTIIKGKTSPNTILQATKDGKIIGTSISKSDGSFSIKVPKQKSRTVITLFAHRERYQSTSIKFVTLNVLNHSTNTIDSSDSIVTGKGPIGAYVQAYVNSRPISKKVKIGLSGSYKLFIKKQKGGTYIVIKMSKSGYAPSEKKTKVLHTFKTHSINSVTRKMTTVSGKATPGASMTAYVGKRKIGSSVKVSSKGTYKIRIPLQKSGTKITVKQSKSGYVTKTKTTTVLNVLTKLTVRPVTKSHTFLSGTADRNSTVKVYVGKKMIGKKTTVNRKGQYRVTIPKQKKGTSIKVVVQKTGYLPLSKTIKVK